MKFRRINNVRTCPECKSADVYRVRRTGIPLKVVCRIVNLRPYWCSACDTFFLAPRRSKPVGIQEQHGLPSGENKGANLPPTDGLTL